MNQAQEGCQGSEGPDPQNEIPCLVEMLQGRVLFTKTLGSSGCQTLDTPSCQPPWNSPLVRTSRCYQVKFIGLTYLLDLELEKFREVFPVLPLARDTTDGMV